MAPVCTLRSLRGARGSFRRIIGALTGAALFVAWASDAAAYDVKRTSHGDLVHWEERTIFYTIDPSVDRNVSHATSATETAMSSWSGTVGAPDLTVADHDDESPTTPGFDKKNGIFYATAGYAPAGRALAITVLTYDNATGRILDADVIFNGDYFFAVLAPPGEDTKRKTTTRLANTDDIVHDDHPSDLPADDAVYDLHHVIAHELGHSLGMNDEMGRHDALMYRYSAPNDATIRQPGSDDIAGLAELYSTKLEGRGNGCGNATVAPKKPSNTAAHATMFATLGLLLFLVLRAKSDRRARIVFVLASTTATIALLPNLSGKGGAGVARASETAPGHARAKVLSTSTAIENGLFKTNYALATMECRTESCPKDSHGSAWGGTIGNVTQEVGGSYAPAPGDEVNVSFKVVTNKLGALVNPLVGLPAETPANVRVVTRAR